MRFLKLYGRVFALLGKDLRLAVLVCLVNLVVAALSFLDPLLFGRVIDLLARSARMPQGVMWQQATHLLLIWVGVGLSAILGNMLIALQSERLAHRNRLQVMGRFYTHVLNLPLSF